MEIHLKITGTLLILLALMHIALPKYFKWKEESRALSLITRQILYVHTVFIGITLLLMGLLCLCYSHALIHEQLGRVILLGLFLFWLLRLFFQFFVYSPKLWRGKLFETTVHIIFSSLWIYFTSVFVMSYLAH
ncbi:hypothetical protein [Pseudochryseolinea flava]|uniref:Cytochrome b561 domain-containing protein n=1 Tax=Pseudochryseolinea flava TaxID=2059302 RepID=A0A364XWE8_9BACT|nr:hypothetical protein [Pseudochryseolinea flava]RAV97717.1 hypothetical protein DQQ10_27140 [Pseudochryseolinea flava]